MTTPALSTDPDAGAVLRVRHPGLERGYTVADNAVLFHPTLSPAGRTLYFILKRYASTEGCAWPGQACGYKLGQTEIVAQRDRAKVALGARFDVRDFNQAVVEGGNVPLDVLGGNITRYIAGARA